MGGQVAGRGAGFWEWEEVLKYYVYELIDPRNGRPFYVGKGKNARIDAHETEARSGRVSRKCDMIRDIEAVGLSVLKRKIQYFAVDRDAYAFEADLINSYGLDNLTNVVPGGRGYVVDPEEMFFKTLAKVIRTIVMYDKIRAYEHEFRLMMIEHVIEAARKYGPVQFKSRLEPYGIDITNVVLV